MTEVREVTGTAFVVAELRARENHQPPSLYLDTVAHIFIDDRTKGGGRDPGRLSAGEKMRGSGPAISTTGLTKQITQGCRQVVILGSGLDTRPCASALTASPISRSTTRTP